MKNFWLWLNTPFEYLLWWQTLLVGSLGGAAVGIVLGILIGIALEGSI